MPLLFGLGFLAPLIAQVIGLVGWTPPGGLPPIALGLAVGGIWGGYAVWRGRWL